MEGSECGLWRMEGPGKEKRSEEGRRRRDNRLWEKSLSGIHWRPPIIVSRTKSEIYH